MQSAALFLTAILGGFLLVSIPALAGAMDFDLDLGRIRFSDLRIGESRAQLGHGRERPSGLLALQGELVMDLPRRTWEGRLGGAVDSLVLGLPGPRFQAAVVAYSGSVSAR